MKSDCSLETFLAISRSFFSTLSSKSALRESVGAVSKSWSTAFSANGMPAGPGWAINTFNVAKHFSMLSMLDLAKHIVEQKSAHFEPDKFEDHYEAALTELLNKKQKGVPLTAAKKPAPSNVVNLMDALRASIGQKGKGSAAAAKPAKKPAKKTVRSKKSA